MNEKTGEKRDVLGFIICAVIMIAMGTFIYSSSNHASQGSFFFGASGSKAERPVLPTVMKPSGQ